jgi:hypothetical protein
MSINIDISNRELFNIPDFRDMVINNIWLDMNSINKIENLPNTITRLFLRLNKIEKLENLPEELEELWINNNNISVIENLPSNLKRLYINSNNISRIESLPENIEVLQLYGNPIKTIPDWILNCKNLYILSVDEDVVLPQDLKSILKSRRINRIAQQEQNNDVNVNDDFANNNDDNYDDDFTNDMDDFANDDDDYDMADFANDNADNYDFANDDADNTGLEIYADNQNVHDTSIQSSLTLSINNILKGPYFNDNIKNVLCDSGLSYTIISYILENSSDETVHEQTGITYAELFRYVFYYIWNSEHYDELLNILEEEIIEGSGLCFVGRLTRLVNVLSGYHDGVTLQIDDKSQIGNIAVLMRSKYSGEELKTNFRKEMKERGYNDDIINEWIEYLE